MKFGIYLGRVVKLVDLETGEIVACGVKSVQNWLLITPLERPKGQQEKGAKDE